MISSVGTNLRDPKTFMTEESFVSEMDYRKRIKKEINQVIYRIVRLDKTPLKIRDTLLDIFDSFVPSLNAIRIRLFRLRKKIKYLRILNHYVDSSQGLITARELSNKIKNTFGVRISASRVKMNYFWRRLRLKPELNEVQIRERFEYANLHLNESFENYIFVDETMIRLNSFPLYHMRRIKIQIPIKLNIWAGISTKFVLFQSNLNRFGDKFLLDKHLYPFLVEKFNCQCVLFQDNDSKHDSRLCVNYLTEKNINWTPANSPDINVIELLWHDLKDYNCYKIELSNREKKFANRYVKGFVYEIVYEIIFLIENDWKIEELEAEQTSFQENNANQQKRIQRLEETQNIKEQETERLKMSSDCENFITNLKKFYIEQENFLNEETIRKGESQKMLEQYVLYARYTFNRKIFSELIGGNGLKLRNFVGKLSIFFGQYECELKRFERRKTATRQKLIFLKQFANDRFGIKFCEFDGILTRHEIKEEDKLLENMDFTQFELKYKSTSEPTQTANQQQQNLSEIKVKEPKPKCTRITKGKRGRPSREMSFNN
ncbi:Transposable element Tcb2 transposase [Brachionus plicatilis]|uniref:Transposable element Tcb2 transposase n=1 Tax=Brachionus plicatilis TaxID=10195 RepID=A0A3M7RST8_BRAPC|nr:Transposable element Tcb2 transposase [Brachionus plicatilis]